MRTIIKSVGNSAANLEQDVRTVQFLLNKNIRRLAPVARLKEDGDCGPITIGVILQFQLRVMGYTKPDGRIDPGGVSIRKLNELAAENGRGEPVNQGSVDFLLLQVQRIIQPIMDLYDLLFTKELPAKKLTEEDFTRAAVALGIEIAKIKAVAAVESAGGGFLNDGRPKILFEGHWFSKLTNHKYDKTHPSISYEKWTKQFYKGGAGEYGRLNLAKGLDKEAALKSTSWGKFQIMGFNHKLAGYITVESYVNDMYKTEALQLFAFVKFLQSKKLDRYLKSKDWANFAKFYNGSKYAENKYDIRLQQAYTAYAAGK
jgi:hypothetical protein